jgi:TonB-linked SusC/RagA family outer membrane protein
MRKVLSLLAVLTVLCMSALAQSRLINGQVKDASGSPLPFASIFVKGTKKGTTSDASGNFSIEAKTGDVLIVSAVGSKDGEIRIGEGNSYTVSLESQTNLQEVVVTALGVKRRPKEIGYANTTISAEQITSGKSPTLGQALSGKMGGLTVYNVNNSVNNDVRVVLRGYRSINGNNQALIVLDGVPVPQNAISYINPDDIESVTALKGGQAATLYGTDGANGVLMITTKKGSRKPTINFSQTVTADVISYMPDFQTGFGSGSDYGNGTPGIENFRPFENQQYGDAFDGQPRNIGRVLEDGDHLVLPYAPVKNQKRDAFDNGYSTQTNFSLSGSDERSSFYLSFQDYSVKGVVPNDKYHRNTFRFNASKTFGKFKASFDASYAVDRTQRTTADFMFLVYNTPIWFPLNDYRDWRNNKFANPNGYFNDYYGNPYFEADNNRRDSRNNYFTGNLTLEFKPLTWLTGTYRLGAAVTNNFGKDFTGKFTYTTWAKSQAPTFDPDFNDYNGIFRARNDVLGSVADYSSWGSRITSDIIIRAEKQFNDFSLSGLVGTSFIVRQGKDMRVASTSIVVPDIYSITNRSGEINGSGSATYATMSDQRKFGYFADATVGYKDFIFLHGSARVDNTSVFYLRNRDKSLYSFPYYGADASFIVTEAFSSLKTSFLDFLKLRLSWNKNANDPLSAYDLKGTFSNASGFPYGSVVGLTIDNTAPDPFLKPEETNTIEGGFELSVLNNRLNLDFSIYNQKSDGNIINVGVSRATGYSSYRVNAASMTNKGIDMDLKYNVIRGKDFTWNLNANYTYNTNKVTKLFLDLPRFQSGSYGTAGFIFAELDQPYPYLKATAFQRDDQGRVIVSGTDGWPLKDPNLKAFGNTLPKHTIGFGTSVGYKGFTLSTTLEYRTGYVTYHTIGDALGFTGAGALSTKYNREPFLWPNSSVDDGTGKYIPNTSVMVDEYWAWYKGWGDVGNPRGAASGNGIAEFYIIDGTFLKVRDITLSYRVPTKALSRLKYVKEVTLTAVGRNLFTFLPAENMYTDPEFNGFSSSSNNIGINTTGNTPPVRSYGLSLNITF